MIKNYETKQVILMRTDLRNTKGEKVRSGKLMAQAAHASMMFLVKRITADGLAPSGNGSYYIDRFPVFSCDEYAWLTGSFAKIVLAVDSLDNMMILVELAKKSMIETHVCVDSGATEFSVPTITCAAIGPFASDAIDKITGHLKTL